MKLTQQTTRVASFPAKLELVSEWGYDLQWAIYKEDPGALQNFVQGFEEIPPHHYRFSMHWVNAPPYLVEEYEPQIHREAVMQAKLTGGHYDPDPPQSKSWKKPNPRSKNITRLILTIEWDRRHLPRTEFNS